MTQQTMGQRIAEKRRGRSLAQEALAEQLSVTPQAVSEWENDASSPDVLLLVCLNGDVMQFYQPMALVKRDMEEGAYLTYARYSG